MTKHYKIIGLRILSWVITITGLIIFIGNVHEYGLHFTRSEERRVGKECWWGWWGDG